MRRFGVFFHLPADHAHHRGLPGEEGSSGLGGTVDLSPPCVLLAGLQKPGRVAQIAHPTRSLSSSGASAVRGHRGAHGWEEDTGELGSRGLTRGDLPPPRRVGATA